MIRKALFTVVPLAAVVSLALIPVSASSGFEKCQPGRPRTKQYCKKMCKVPKLKGKTVNKGRILLRKNDCKLGKVIRKHHKGGNAGRIYKTVPKAGTIKRDGFRVNLYVKKKSQHHH